MDPIHQSMLKASNKPVYSEANIKLWANADIKKYGSVEAALTEAKDENNMQLVAHLKSLL